jgi:hypothetical protein
MIVEMPDGTKVSFPDDMPKEQIKSLIASKFPELATPQTQLGADRAQANDAQVAEQTAEGRREAYNQKPWYQQAAQAADDEMRLLSSGITMGFADKMAAGLNSSDRSYEDQLKIEREATQAARDRASSAALPSEIAGAVMTGSLAANSGATLAGRLGTANMTGWRGLMARAGLMAPEGALYGATDALGNDKDVKEGAVIGAIAGPLGSVVADGVSSAASRVLPRRPGTGVPELDQLRNQARQAYEAADNAGVIVNPQSTQRLQQNIQQELADFGYHPQLQPGIGAILNDLDRISQGNTTLRGLDVLRRIANNARQSNVPSERAAANIVIEQIDNHIQGLQPQDLISGNSREGINSLLQARNIWTRVAKNERFMNAVNSADLRAASTGSGGNVENATRQNLRRLIDPSSRTAPRNWTADERTAINEIVRGSPTQNVLRLAGKLSPSGNGLMAALGIGGTMANPMIGVASLGGMAAKYAADRGVMQGVQALDELIRAGGTQQALQAAQGALRRLTPAQRQALGRLVEMSIIQSEVRQQEPAQ